jgi:hypothetical protein
MKQNDKQNKKRKISLKLKKWQIALICVLAVLLAFCIFLVVWFYGDRYSDFDDFSEEFEIPGLSENFAPQGMTYYSNYFFVSGYMNDGSASRVYVVYRTTTNNVNTYSNRGYFTLKYKDGWNKGESTDTVYRGHAGGIATDGQTIWITSDSTVYTLKYSSTSDLRKSSSTADNTVDLTFEAKFNANCNASFAYYYSSTLYVGEFYRKGNYETDASHRFKDENGTQYNAVYFEFTTNSGANSFGVTSAKTDPNGNSIGAVPKYAVAIPDRVQGMSIANNTVVFSQSYGLANSHMLTYKYSSTRSSYLTESDNTIKWNEGKATEYDVPVYFLSEQVNDYTIPCMSEGLCTYNSRVYVLFESAASKYKPFVRESLNHVYAFKPTSKAS